jgi:hypothetical protein
MAILPMIMDLSTVKTAVKAWEKAFKLRHGRDPTKEEIKKDPSGIGRFGLYTANSSRAICPI